MKQNKIKIPFSHIAYCMDYGHASFEEAYAFVEAEEEFLVAHHFYDEDNDDYLFIDLIDYIWHKTGFNRGRVSVLSLCRYKAYRESTFGSRERFEQAWEVLIEILENNLKEKYIDFYQDTYSSFENNFYACIDEYTEKNDLKQFGEVMSKYMSINARF